MAFYDDCSSGRLRTLRKSTVRRLLNNPKRRRGDSEIISRLGRNGDVKSRQGKTGVRDTVIGPVQRSVCVRGNTRATRAYYRDTQTPSRDPLCCKCDETTPSVT
jgi:hypothetical protein